VEALGVGYFFQLVLRLVFLSTLQSFLLWMTMIVFLTFGRGLLFCSPSLLDSLRGSSVQFGTIQKRLAWPLRKDDTHKSRSVIVFKTSRLLPGKEDLQITKTKLTQTTEMAAKRLQRRSQGSLPSRPAPSPTLLRGGDESWPRLENLAAQNGRLAPRQHR
jgi:hypothetical protein